MLVLPSAEVLDGAVPQLLERHAARVGAAKGSGAGGSSGRLPGERLGAKRSGGYMSEEHCELVRQHQWWVTVAMQQHRSVQPLQWYSQRVRRSMQW